MKQERGNGLLRQLDRWVGIPLVCLLGTLKKKRICPRVIRSIALLKSAGIGDTALLTGIIQDLKKGFPEGQLTLFTGTTNREMGEMIEGIRVVALPITQPFKSLRKLRSQYFDLWIDFDPWPRINALFSYFSHSQWSLGFKTRGQYRHYVYDETVVHNRECHELENYRSLVAAAGVQEHSLPFLQVEGEEQKTIVLHLFSGGSRAELKMWSEEKWKRLAGEFIRKGYEVQLTGGKKDEKRLQQIAGIIGKGCTVETGSLRETALLLKKALCLISVDTGIMHLGSIIGCRVIALHGPTSPLRWGGVGKRVFSVTPPFAYRPCIHLGFEKSCRTNACMEGISVESVLAVFEKVIYSTA